MNYCVGDNEREIRGLCIELNRRADEITELGNKMAERDRELARVTAERDTLAAQRAAAPDDVWESVRIELAGARRGISADVLASLVETLPVVIRCALGVDEDGA